MVRIIPWSLPPIAGGSQGGYTPQEEDVPVTPSYYDVDNVVITRVAPAYGSTAKYLDLKVSGITVVNVVGVASANLIVNLATDSTSQAAADAAEGYAATKALTSAQILDPNVQYNNIFYNNVTAKYCSVRKIELVLYDGNGTILATYTLTEDLDGQQ